MRLLLALCLTSLCIVELLAAPADTTLSLVVSTTEAAKERETDKEEVTVLPPTVPKIYQMHVQSEVKNRYANTTVTSKVKNVANRAQGVTFSVVLPETAFISAFVMEVNGTNYTAYVDEKEEAKKTYDKAVASGLGAAHVALSARDSNRFTVSVNVEAQTKAAFYLVYEQLLKRRDGIYELIINLHPGQPVKDLSVEVVIKESRAITNLKAPPLRTGNELVNEKPELDPRADIENPSSNTAIVRFSPNLERQKQLASLLGTSEGDGLAGQFVVQYDVERDPKGGEVLVQDGYFVHFFAPEETETKPLPKHVVFVLDTSYSMVWDKIQQVRDAMTKILGELKEEDLFNLVEFNTNVKVWDLDDSNSSVWYPTEDENTWREDEVAEEISNFTFPDAYPANANNIEKAKAAIKELEPNGGTDIQSALNVGLYLVELARNKNESGPQPIIVFLTDGEPTIGMTLPNEISDKISEYNSDIRTSPIYTLSFGDGADRGFLQKLSLRNSGFSRHIYQAADAALQLQDFYRQISSPLLSNVTFKYEPTVTSLTTTDFPIHYGGSEIVVAGWCGTGDVNPSVEGVGVDGLMHYIPFVERPVSNLERLWAYLTVKQILDKREVTSDKDEKDKLKHKALSLALKYSFVTSVSSLVVVKPNDKKSLDDDDDDDYDDDESLYQLRMYASSPASFQPLAAEGSLHAVKSASAYAGSPAGQPLLGSADADFGYEVAEENEDYSTEEAATGEVDESTRLNNQTSDLLNVLPWLEEVLNENGTLALSSGYYDLGLNITINEDIDCPQTPSSEAGHCKLLQQCAQVHSLLTTFDIFSKYSCVINDRYVGVCCPETKS